MDQNTNRAKAIRAALNGQMKADRGDSTQHAPAAFLEAVTYALLDVADAIRETALAEESAER